MDKSADRNIKTAQDMQICGGNDNENVIEKQSTNYHSKILVDASIELW